MDEPFGYIPVESMACGTPVLTYAWQGPGETVVDGVTGWLAHDDAEIVKLATRLESDGYPNSMRNDCRSHGLNFDVRHIVKEWMKYIEG
jgi:glycosyltransferase involved in cell wall biosynthesis